MPIEILAFLIDDENRDKFAHHGLSADQILQVLDDRFVTYRNRRGRRASHVVLGRDYGGACIAIAVEPTDDSYLLASCDGVALQAQRENAPDEVVSATLD